MSSVHRGPRAGWVRGTGVAYRRDLRYGVRLSLHQLLGGPRLQRHWLQWAPGLQRQVFEAQIYGGGLRGWQIHAAHFVHNTQPTKNGHPTLSPLLPSPSSLEESPA